MAAVQFSDRNTYNERKIKKIKFISINIVNASENKNEVQQPNLNKVKPNRNSSLNEMSKQKDINNGATSDCIYAAMASI